MLHRSSLGRAVLSRSLILAAVAGTLGGVSQSALGQVTTSQWLNAVSGNWSDPTLWSTNPFYPDNGNGNPFYRAEFLATGANYTATLNSNIALDSLLLNSANATIAHTAGTLTLGGTATLTAGTFNLNGGTIAGGTIDNTANKLSIANSVNNTLSGVSVIGGLNVGGFQSKVKVLNGLSATGTVNLNGTSNLISFMNSQSFSGGTINVAGSSAATNNSISIEGTSAFTLAAGATISGRHARIGFQAYTAGANSFINAGTVNANSSGIITIMSSSFTNTGTALASNGGTLTINSANWSSSGTIQANASSTVNINGNWSSSGALNASGGTINLGGTFSTAGLAANITGAGAVNITGIANNTGNTLAFTAATGSWSLNGGTINGGTLSFAGGQQLLMGQGASTLINVSVLGDWTPASTFMDFTIQGSFSTTGALRLNGSAGVAHLVNATVDSHIELSGGNKTIATDTNETFTAASSVTATSGAHTIAGIGGSVTQNGSVLATGASTTLYFHPTDLVNNGLIRVEAGATLQLGRKAVGILTTLNNTGAIEVDHATLNLQGGLVTSRIGTINNNAGTINFAGSIDNTGDTLDLSAHGGSWNLGSAAVTGGTLNLSAAGNFLFTNSSQLSLTNVNVNGVLNMTGGADQNQTNYLSLTGNIALNGTINFNSAYSSGLIYGATTLNGGTYSFNSTSGPAISLLGQTGSSLVITSGTTIRGGRGSISSAGTCDFDGHIIGDVAGQVVGVGGTGVSHINGVIDVLGGGASVGSTAACYLNSAVTINGGTFSMGSTAGLHLGSGFSLNRTGGTVTVTGLLDNTASTLNLNASTGSWILQSTIRGGTLNLSDGVQFLGPALIYDNINVNGNFSIQRNESIRVLTRMNLNGEITLASGASLILDANGAIPTSTEFNGGTIRAIVGSSDQTKIEISGPTAVILGAGTTIIAGGNLGSSFNTSVGKDRTGGNNSTLINRGSIICETNKELTVRPNHLFNEGTLQANAGGYLKIAGDIGNTWASSGTILADGGTVWIQGLGTTATLGTVRAINGGTILLGGSLDNSGQTLTLNDFTGSYLLDVGTIKGGHVATSGSARLNFGNAALDGVTFDQDMIVDHSATVTVRNFDINGSVKLQQSSSLAFGVDQTFNRTIEFSGAAPASTRLSCGAFNAATTLTLGTSAVVRGGNGQIYTNSNSTIVNQGLISADVNGQSIQILLARFINEGTIQAINGGILDFVPPPGAGPDAGTLLNSGILSLAGHTSMYGNIVQTMTGHTNLFLNNAALEELSVFSIQGSADLSGAVTVVLGDDISLHQGDVIHLISASHLRWNPDSLLILPEFRGELLWDRQHIESGVLKVIPTPGVLPLSLATLAIVAGRRRR